jgi:hypothetical protein
MDVLAAAVRKALEDRLEKHLLHAFPKQASALGSGGLKALVKSGIARAATYDVMLEPDVRRYLELALCYGADFDTALKSKWAGEILKRDDLTGSEKINELDSYELFELGGGPA